MMYSSIQQDVSPCQYQFDSYYNSPEPNGFNTQHRQRIPISETTLSTYYCQPNDHQNQLNPTLRTSPTVEAHSPLVDDLPQTLPSHSSAPLPAIANFMKEVQIKEEYNDFYPQNIPMSEYRVEKVQNSLMDPYIQLEQPTYADFTNTNMLNQQDMISQMNFSNQLSTNYMSATQLSQPQSVPFNLFDLNISSFNTFNQTCDASLQLMHQSPPSAQQPTYVMTPHTTFTPPPQDPLVAEQKPPKKRMPAVQCHQNSICSNCKTRETTLWRRNGDGGVECNACNLYFRKNHRKRPLSLRKDGIMKRNRRPRNESPNHK